MAGTKYTTKQTLIDAWKALIFPNKQKLITGVAHQTAGLDLIESLWPEAVAPLEYIYLTGVSGYNLMERANYTVFDIPGGTNTTLGLPSPSEEMLGDWEFYNLLSVGGGTMTITGGTYTSSGIPEGNSLIIRCIKYYLGDGVTFSYDYKELLTN